MFLILYMQKPTKLYKSYINSVINPVKIQTKTARIRKVIEAQKRLSEMMEINFIYL